jgi:hypothetical protein
MLVSYLFRTTGQVLGVSLSGALTQAILAKELGERITGEGAEEVGTQSFRPTFTDSTDHHLYSAIVYFNPASIASPPRSSHCIIPESSPCCVYGWDRPYRGRSVGRSGD